MMYSYFYFMSTEEAQQCYSASMLSAGSINLSPILYQGLIGDLSGVYGDTAQLHINDYHLELFELPQGEVFADDQYDLSSLSGVGVICLQCLQDVKPPPNWRKVQVTVKANLYVPTIESAVFDSIDPIDYYETLNDYVMSRPHHNIDLDITELSKVVTLFNDPEHGKKVIPMMKGAELDRQGDVPLLRLTLIEPLEQLVQALPTKNDPKWKKIVPASTLANSTTTKQ